MTEAQYDALQDGIQKIAKHIEKAVLTYTTIAPDAIEAYAKLIAEAGDLAASRSSVRYQERVWREQDEIMHRATPVQETAT